MYPTRSTQPSCITFPTLTTNFKIKYGMIQMLLVFRELINENPYQYVREFEDICGTMKYNQMIEESLKLRVFPFSLKKKFKAELLSLQPGSIFTWVALAEAFYRKFYSKQKTATIRQAFNLTPSINYKRRRFSHILKESRIFGLSILTMDLKRSV